MREDTETDISAQGFKIPPGMMHRDEANFMSIDRRGEPRNLFPHFVAIAALIAIIVICVF